MSSVILAALSWTFSRSAISFLREMHTFEWLQTMSKEWVKHGFVWVHSGAFCFCSLLFYQYAILNTWFACLTAAKHHAEVFMTVKTRKFVSEVVMVHLRGSSFTCERKPEFPIFITSHLLLLNVAKSPEIVGGFFTLSLPPCYFESKVTSVSSKVMAPVLYHFFGINLDKWDVNFIQEK